VPVLLDQIIAAARTRLRASGHNEATSLADADLLARHALDWDRTTLLIRRREPAPEGFEAAFGALVARRAAYEPIAYITGRREFWGLDLEVTPDVLIPRPETEFVVEEALAAARALVAAGQSRTLRVIDVGTGSGCLAIALARELPDVRVTAVELSTAALAVAARNARRHVGSSRIAWVNGDLLRPFGARVADIIVANPPYVVRGDTALARDVRRFEPSLALYSDGDGLEHIRRLLLQAADVLAPGAFLIFEFGYGQDSRIVELVNETSALRVERVRHDLQGIPRVMVVEKTAVGDPNTRQP
jgi:release factor glutamine methyltransferase